MEFSETSPIILLEWTIRLKVFTNMSRGEQHKVFGEIQADVDRYNDMSNINCRLDHCVLPH
jgi:hypothetical protein